MTLSPLHRARYAYIPCYPAILNEPLESIELQAETTVPSGTQAEKMRAAPYKNTSLKPSPQEAAHGTPAQDAAHQAEIASLFPHTYGMPIVHLIKGKSTINNKPLRAAALFSGGQAPGGHNVIAGLYDALKKAHPDSVLYGFLGGPDGLLTGNAMEITSGIIAQYSNTGGFDMIGTGRTKIETPEQVAAAIKTVQQLALDAVVIIGGDDSNTNAAVLAEYFVQHRVSTQIIGVPKTIDGDLRYKHTGCSSIPCAHPDTSSGSPNTSCARIETSFGFDTATKIYADLIGTIARDTSSSKKHWHFIKLMGRYASHITLECALRTQPNVSLIAEEIADKNMTLQQVAHLITDAVVKRAAHGESFGIVLIPEGIIEFIPEIKTLIRELNAAIEQYPTAFAALSAFDKKRAWLGEHISTESAQVLCSIPEDIVKELLMDRDEHGNLQVSRIETEHLLVGLVKKQLAELKAAGVYKGKFSAQTHFFGYEGRSEFPSNFDANYCYALGRTCCVLIANRLTGYMTSVYNLAAPPAEWQPCGIPLTKLMDMEVRAGKPKPVIKKAIVDLNAQPFKTFAAHRDRWAVETTYIFPGPIQYFGSAELCDECPKSLLLEYGN